jgi:tetratricopeptide (TPR) repeat protein
MKTRGFFLLVLVALTLGLFSRSVGKEFIWDDEFFIQENRFLRSWESLPELFTTSMTAGSGQPHTDFYRPLQALTHFLDVQLYGLDAWWHHTTNLLLAALVAAVLFLLLCDLLEGERKEDIPWAAFFALSLWLFHPLQSEIVGYLSGRGDTLVFLFSGAAALAWPRSRRWASFFCLCALLSKESGVLAPLLVLLCDLVRQKKTGNGSLDLRAYLTPVLLTLAYIGARLTFLSFHNTLNFYNQQNVLTEHYEYRVFTYLSTLGKSLQLIFWPMGLHHERGWLVFADWRELHVIAGFFALLSALAAAVLTRRRKPLVAVGLFWFVAATLPTSNLIALINALFYDHWFVWPAFGLALVLAAVFARARARLPRVLPATAWLVLVLPLSCLTWQQNAHWQTREAQYLHVLSFEPKAWKIMNNLAMHYADLHRLPEAEELYRKSLELSESAQARNNLGRLYLTQGKFDAALKELSRAVEVDPGVYQARTGLGLAQLSTGNCAEARENFVAALRIFPDPAAEKGLEKARACGP